MKITTLLSIPRSFLICLRTLPLEQAIHIPIIVDKTVVVKGVLSKDSCIIMSNQIKMGMINIGTENGSFIQGRNQPSFLEIKDKSKIVFNGNCRIAKGCKIMVSNHGIIEFGDQTHFNSGVMISSNSHVCFGDGVRSGWNCTIIDWDGHNIIDMNTKNIINPPRPISIGEHTWIGSHATILKGVNLAHHSIIPYGSIVTKSNNDPYTVYGGTPCRVIKKNVMRSDKYEEWIKNGEHE